MKKLFILFALAFISFGAQAQLPFSFDHDTLFMAQPDPGIFENILDNHISNNTGQTLDLVWTRITEDLAPDKQSAICIRDQCYPPSTSTLDFTLNPNESDAIVSAHLWNLATPSPAYGVVQVKIELANDPSTFGIITFIFGELMVDTDEATAAKARIFPNPSSDYFQLENADWVKQIQLMDVQGKIVRAFTATTGQSYNIADIPVGSYYAILSDDTGKAVRSMRIEKQ